MNQNRHQRKTEKTVEIRFRLDVDDDADIAAMAKYSGLAKSTFVRTIIRNYLNKK